MPFTSEHRDRPEGGLEVGPARPSRSCALYDCFLAAPVYGVWDSVCDRSDRSGSEPGDGANHCFTVRPGVGRNGGCHRASSSDVRDVRKSVAHHHRRRAFPSSRGRRPGRGVVGAVPRRLSYPTPASAVPSGLHAGQGLGGTAGRAATGAHGPGRHRHPGGIARCQQSQQAWTTRRPSNCAEE